MGGHGRRPGTYFQGQTPSGHFLGQCSLDSLHCDQLICRKISKIVATRCQILRLKCTKIDFCEGAPLGESKGLLLRGGKGKGRKGKTKGKLKGKDGKEKGGRKGEGNRWGW